MRLVWCLIIAVLLFFIAKDVWAEDRSIQPTILFSFDGDAAEVDHFELHWIPIPGSGVIEYICTLDNQEIREWETPAFDMEIGSVRPFYLVAVMLDGRKGWSPYYNFRFTGKPFIFKVTQEPLPTHTIQLSDQTPGLAMHIAPI